MTSDASSITPRQVAEWMAAQIEEEGELVQRAAARQIQGLFGDGFITYDPAGDPGIHRRVLYQFKKITGDSVVWVAVQGSWLDGFWRLRHADDRPGRLQYFYR